MLSPGKRNRLLKDGSGYLLRQTDTVDIHPVCIPSTLFLVVVNNISYQTHGRCVPRDKIVVVSNLEQLSTGVSTAPEDPT
ncbi:hypothetical protein NPIL_193151 [Nephila pilipes]|uniref:Uncharacterized protein n=1 Tax=Nephila pilipes TaxID=299642 RepID=A0A8X6PDU3_NEPPI|nr:hypothetical protein NPIL_193151 [Nephila pilipes]